MIYHLGFCFLFCPANWPASRYWLLLDDMPLPSPAQKFNLHQVVQQTILLLGRTICSCSFAGTTRRGKAVRLHRACTVRGLRARACTVPWRWFVVCVLCSGFVLLCRAGTFRGLRASAVPKCWLASASSRRMSSRNWRVMKILGLGKLGCNTTIS
jgi:hypothetical protein